MELNAIFKKPDTHDIDIEGYMRLKYEMGKFTSDMILAKLRTKSIFTQIQMSKRYSECPLFDAIKPIGPPKRGVSTHKYVSMYSEVLDPAGIDGPRKDGL